MPQVYSFRLLLPSLVLASLGSWVDRYSTSFTHMLNATDSFPASWQGMPIGDGDTVALAYVETNGDIAFLIGKSDAYDEFHELIKVGRVRVSLQPPLDVHDGSFKQTLHLGNASMTVEAGPYQLVAFVFQGVIRLNVSRRDAQEFTARSSTEIWRNSSHQVPSYGGGPCGCGACNKSTHIRLADTLTTLGGETVAWYHRNELRPDVFHHGGSLWEQELRIAGLGRAIDHGLTRDTLTNRTFGAALRGEEPVSGWRRTANDTIEVKSAHIVLAIDVLTATTGKAERFLELLRWHGQEASRTRMSALEQHRAAWKGAWARSRIVIQTSTNTTQNVTHITAMYAATRYIALLELRGGPKKFNGGIFNPDLGAFNGYCTNVPPGGVGGQCSADYRGWGGAYWFQNTRHSYWPRLADGDYGLMEPWFNLFVEALPLAQERTRLWWQHEGSWFHEMMWNFGVMPSDVYGCNREKRPPSWIQCTYHRYYYTNSLELSWLMIERYMHTLDDAFALQSMLPVVTSVLHFFYEHFGPTPAGAFYNNESWCGKVWTDEAAHGPHGDMRMVLNPAQALETWQECINPTDMVAGLLRVTRSFLELPDSALRHVSREDLLMVKHLNQMLPALPTRTDEHGNVYLPSGEYCSRRGNDENTEMYVQHPFHLLSVNQTPESSNVSGGVTNLSVVEGRTTYHRRLFPKNVGETADVMQAARLGLADEAAWMVHDRFMLTFDNAEQRAFGHSLRWPGFFGVMSTDFNWFPDAEHSDGAAAALQWMLLQSDGDRILLFPAWPKAWEDVEFKLHTWQDTVVEVHCRGGESQRLIVTPPARAADVVWVGDVCRPAHSMIVVGEAEAFV